MGIIAWVRRSVNDVPFRAGCRECSNVRFDIFFIYFGGLVDHDSFLLRVLMIRQSPVEQWNPGVYLTNMNICRWGNDIDLKVSFSIFGEPPKKPSILETALNKMGRVHSEESYYICALF